MGAETDTVPDGWLRNFIEGFAYTLVVCGRESSHLTLLQLMPPIFPDFLEKEETRIRESLRALVPIEAQAWCKPEFVVRGGFPADGILKFAEENDVDLIVMGLRKSSEAAMPDHLPWPVASQVVAEVRCPVLTVRG